MAEVEPQVPDALSSYVRLIEFMIDQPGLYGLDERRAQLHEELCEFYGLEPEVSRSVTDQLDIYPTVFSVHRALETLSKKGN